MFFRFGKLCSQSYKKTGKKPPFAIKNEVTKPTFAPFFL